jgi:hypothetical protein
MYQQQQRDSIAFWNRQNEYNTPANQMARLEEAGINKLLPFTSGNSPQNTASAPTVPSQQVSQARAPQLGDALEAMYDLRLKKSGINKINEETRGLKTTNDRAALQFAYDRLYMAENAQNKKDQLFWESEIKAVQGKILEQQLDAGERSEHGSQGALNFNEQVNRVKNLQQARALIKAQKDGQELKNMRLKKLDEMLKSMPKGTEGIQQALWLILTK